MFTFTCSDPTVSMEVIRLKAWAVRPDLRPVSRLRLRALASSGVSSWKVTPGRSVMVQDMKSPEGWIDSAR